MKSWTITFTGQEKTPRAANQSNKVDDYNSARSVPETDGGGVSSDKMYIV